MRALDLRPPRARCQRCSFRFEVLPDVQLEDKLACPKCHVLIPVEYEHLDEEGWRWATRQPLTPVWVDDAPVQSRKPAARPALPQRRIGVEV